MGRKWLRLGLTYWAGVRFRIRQNLGLGSGDKVVRVRADIPGWG